MPIINYLENTGMAPSLHQLDVDFENLGELTFVPSLAPQIETTRGRFGSKVFFVDFSTLPVNATNTTSVVMQVQCTGGDRNLLQILEADSIPPYPPMEFVKVQNSVELEVPVILTNKLWYLGLTTQHDLCKWKWSINNHEGNSLIHLPLQKETRRTTYTWWKQACQLFPFFLV